MKSKETIAPSGTNESNILKPVNEKDLNKWEKALDDSNLNCYVPEGKLQLLFSDEDKKLILSQGSLNKDSISYLSQKNAIAVRSLNNGYVWSEIFSKINFNRKTVTELGPGTSPVLDIALGFLKYNGKLIKVDYSEYAETNEQLLKQHFDVQKLVLDIVKETDKLPKTDMFTMNHFWDDLYMGLWSADNNMDYFGYAINKIEENNKFWEQAINKKNKYLPEITKLIDKLSQKVNKNGFVIMRSFPSGFETHFNQTKRINFTFEITNFAVEEFLRNKFKQIPIDLNKINGPVGSKYPNSFFVLQKKLK